MIPILIMLAVVFYILMEIYWDKKFEKIESFGTRYNTACAALIDYMKKWIDSVQKSNLEYQIPASYTDLNSDMYEIKTYPQFQKLFKELQRAYVEYLEVRSSQIDQGVLLELLNYFKDDDEFYNRIMNLILYRKPKRIRK